MAVAMNAIKALIQKLPKEKKDRSFECAKKLTAIIEEYKDVGLLSLGVVMASIESAIDEEEGRV